MYIIAKCIVSRVCQCAWVIMIWDFIFHFEHSNGLWFNQLIWSHFRSSYDMAAIKIQFSFQIIVCVWGHICTHEKTNNKPSTKVLFTALTINGMCIGFITLGYFLNQNLNGKFHLWFLFIILIWNKSLSV